MIDLTELASKWRLRLDQLVRELDVPGAAVGVSLAGERLVFSSGVESMRSGHPVIPATAFQLGSISKVYTTTLLAAVTQLDKELLARSVATLIPEADWMDPAITVWHLLTHSSGLGGDCFADTGRGDDALVRYVQQLQRLRRDFPGPPGERYSYCNSGFAVLGRLIEVLTGTTYAAALKTHLLTPLGVRETTALPQETLLWPHALGHNRFADGKLKPDDVWHFARAADPIGGICAPVDDLLTFAEMHLADGVAKDGTRIIPAQSAMKMREPQLQTPELARPSARGLGWGIFRTDQGTVIGHDGETLGQIAKLRLVPELKLALAVLTNGIPDGNQITREFETAILGAAGITISPVKVVPVDHFDAHPYLGRYRNLEGLVEVSASSGGLRLRNVQEAEGLWGEEDVTELLAAGQDTFVDASDHKPVSVQRFGDRDRSGRCQSYYNGRVFWRIDD